MRTDSKLLRILTFSYIYLPVFLFLAGYIRLKYCLAIILICVFYIDKMINAFEKDSKEEGIKISFGAFAFIFALILLYCILIGYGGIFEQAGDWSKHNAILHDLCEKTWPVYYTEYEQAMLTYYLGQYMVPALIGKVFGLIPAVNAFMVSHVAMAIWAVLGIVLVFLNLVRVTLSDTVFKQIRTLLIMFFFSGALPLVQLMVNGIYGDNMYSLGNGHWLLYDGLIVQYRSNMVMLRWVYPQVIVVWLIVILFIENIDKIEHYVVLLTPILLFGTFSIIIPAICALVVALSYLFYVEDKKKILKKIFSVSNISVFITLGTVLLIYYIGYMQVTKPAFWNLHLQDINTKNVWGIIIFDILMFGIYSWAVFKEQKNNIIFYPCILSLSVLPIFKMGLYNDLVMCASIPALFCLMIWVIQTLNKNENTKSHGVRVGIIAFCIIIGTWYPVLEISEAVKLFASGEKRCTVEDYYGSLEVYADRDSTEQEDLVYNYFTYDLEDKLFYKYLVRKKIGE